ncbi:hypothetical protein [Rubeoparvulum massiliense]|uniref:hypothetical protein n=1 Tax=Rubeoparvulum massiliense TaxID=1631346 RepID=UPI00065DFF9D|nr:hypothetical protein [Rubeoparvulum massiliense]
MNRQKKLKTYQLINLLAFALMIVINVLADTLPFNGITTSEVAKLYPNLFMPADITFAIWGVIYLALAMYILFQFGIFVRKGKDQIDFVFNVGWLFTVSALANVNWLLFWHNQQILSSLFTLIILLITLGMINKQLRRRKLVSNREKWFVHIPFSIYFSWTMVATLANLNTYLVVTGMDAFDAMGRVWTAMLLLVATFIALIFLVKRHDLAYSLVTIWALLGIILKQVQTYNSAYTSVIVTSSLCILLIVAGMAYVLLKKKDPQRI